MTLPLFLRASQPRATVAILAAVAAGPSACVKYLPPAPPPPPVAPRVDAPAPPAGTARLVVDVVEGAIPVQRVHMRPEPSDNGRGRLSVRFVEVPEPLCTSTPCVADLPPGNILLGFPVLGDPGSREVELVHVGPEPSVYRRSLSIYDGRTGGLRVFGILGTSIGGTSMIAGTTLLPIGLAKDSAGLTLAGGITLGAGAALLALGIWAIRHDAPTFRPGSSSHFPLSF